MPAHDLKEPFTLEIVVRGRLDPRRFAWFDGLTIPEAAGGETRITGTVKDDAALFALVSRIRDLGLKLISIRRTDNPAAESEKHLYKRSFIK